MYGHLIGNVKFYIAHDGTDWEERVAIPDYNTGPDFYNEGPPNEGLSVSGDINMSSGSSLRINGVAQTFSSFVEGSVGIYYPSSGTTKRVAINTTYPTRYLDVAGTISSSNGGILIRNGDTNSGAYYAPQIAFGWNGTNTYQHFIQTRHSSNVSQNAIDFYVCDSTQANYLGVNGGITHNLTLEAGNVGIGTISPKAQLHVRREGSSGESNVYIQSYSDAAGDQAALFLGTPHVTGGTAQPKCAIIADAVGYSRANLHFCLETTQDNGSAYRASTSNSRMMIDGLTGYVGIGTSSPTATLHVNGTVSKSSGSFQIDHPLPNMSNTHYLYHSFIEGPQADLIYRGKVDLVNGSASINLDTVSKMTSGTFGVLNRNVQCFTSNESDWDAVKGSVSGNTLTISCQNASSTANVSWLVIGERKDKHMYDTGWTDDDGFVIPEQLK